MKLWIDDIRPAPEGYIWIKSVNKAKEFILNCEREYSDNYTKTGIFDLDLLARDLDMDGGDYIELLKWLESTHRMNYTFRLHSANPVYVENMRKIIEYNEHRNWKEIK